VRPARVPTLAPTPTEGSSNPDWTSQLAPFDERFACLLDEVSWPEAQGTPAQSARRLASPWLAHGLMMAMATGAAVTVSGCHDANRPIQDAAAEAEPAIVILLDVSIATPADTRPEDVRPLPHEACTADGGQGESLDGSCDVTRLEDAVSRVAGWRCEANGSPGAITHLVVIDCDGRAIELLDL
jgi:hypothetical protein